MILLLVILCVLAVIMVVVCLRIRRKLAAIKTNRQQVQHVADVLKNQAPARVKYVQEPAPAVLVLRIGSDGRLVMIGMNPAPDRDGLYIHATDTDRPWIQAALEKFGLAKTTELVSKGPCPLLGP